VSPRAHLPPLPGLRRRLAAARRVAAVLSAVATLLGAMPQPCAAAAPSALVVTAVGELPGFKTSDLPGYLALQMGSADLPEWRFESQPAVAAKPADWVEWRFWLNPYVRGDLRRVIPIPSVSRAFGDQYLISAELKLYLGGQYQTMVFGQTPIQGGPEDPALAAFVIDLSRSLLGPTGGYQAMIGGGGAGSGTAARR